MNRKSSMESGLRRAVAGLVFGLTLVALTLPPEAAARDLFVSRIAVLAAEWAVHEPAPESRGLLYPG